MSALIIVTTSCYKKCEDFNYDIIQWFPYYESDNLLLSNLVYIDTLTINSIEITHTDGYSRFALCACENSFGVELSSTNLDILAWFHDSRSFVDSYVIINNEVLDFHQHLDSYEINGKEYFDLLEYTNSGYDQSINYSKVIIAKSIGILTILGSEEEWITIDDSNRETEASGIKTIIEGC